MGDPLPRVRSVWNPDKWRDMNGVVHDDPGWAARSIPEDTILPHPFIPLVFDIVEMEADK